METLLYVICLTVGLMFAITSAVSGSLLGADAQPGPDAAGGLASETRAAGSSYPRRNPLLNPTVLASFVAGFGAAGLLLERVPAAGGGLVGAALALFGGILAAGGVVLVQKLLLKSALLGLSATVIMAIPENGVGEIAYLRGGVRHTAAAREIQGRPLAAGTAVKIRRVAGDCVYVQATAVEAAPPTETASAPHPGQRRGSK